MLVFNHVIGYEDEAEYTCVVFNLGGRAHMNFSVRVRDPPPRIMYWITASILLVVAAAVALTILLACLLYLRMKKKTVLSSASRSHDHIR